MFFSHSYDSVDILMQVDRRARGLGSLLSEALEMDESHVQFSLTTQDISNLTEKLRSIIQQYS